MANKISKKPVKSTSRTNNIAPTDLTYTNDFKGYMLAYNKVYNSVDNFKKGVDNLFNSKMI